MHARHYLVILGRNLILYLCGYEVVALEVEHHSPKLARWIKPLSHWAHCHRRNPIAVTLILVLTFWLLWHLLFE